MHVAGGKKARDGGEALMLPTRVGKAVVLRRPVWLVPSLLKVVGPVGVVAGLGLGGGLGLGAIALVEQLGGEGWGLLAGLVLGLLVFGGLGWGLEWLLDRCQRRLGAQLWSVGRLGAASPEAAAIFVESAKRKGLMTPHLYWLPSATPLYYGYRLAGWRGRPAGGIVVSQGLLDLLTPEELAAAIAQAWGQVEPRRNVLLTLGVAINLGLARLGLGDILEGLWAPLARLSQWQADHRGAELTAQPLVLAIAHLKISQQLVVKGHMDPATQAVLRHFRWLLPWDLGAVTTGATLMTWLAKDEQALATEFLGWEKGQPWGHWGGWQAGPPRLSHRLLLLGDYAQQLGQTVPPYLQRAIAQVPSDPQSLSAAFWFDLLIHGAPWLGLGIGVWQSQVGGGLTGAALGWGLGLMVRTSWVFPTLNESPLTTMGALVGQKRTSPVRGKAVNLTGTLITLPTLTPKPRFGLCLAGDCDQVEGYVALKIKGNQSFLPARVGESVTVRGWLHRGRQLTITVATLSQAQHHWVRQRPDRWRWLLSSFLIGAALVGLQWG